MRSQISRAIADAEPIIGSDRACSELHAIGSLLRLVVISKEDSVRFIVGDDQIRAGYAIAVPSEYSHITTIFNDAISEQGVSNVIVEANPRTVAVVNDEISNNATVSTIEGKSIEVMSTRSNVCEDQIAAVPRNDNSSASGVGYSHVIDL
jgi:hypothetical protein